LIASCNQTKHTSVQSLYKQVNDKEGVYFKQSESNGIKIGVQYWPNELEAYRQIEISDSTINDYDYYLSQLNDVILFKVFIESVDGNEDVLSKNLVSQSQYDERLRYLNGKLQDNITLIINDTIKQPAIIYGLERFYKLKGQYILNIGFSKPTHEIYKLSVIVDDEVIGAGLHHFNFDMHKLTNQIVVL
jgi:hypothetical protein